MVGKMLICTLCFIGQMDVTQCELLRKVKQVSLNFLEKDARVTTHKEPRV